MTIGRETDNARQTLIEGVIQGRPFGETVVEILQAGINVGEELAQESDNFYASVNCDNIDQLKLSAVEQATDDLFSSKGIKLVASNVITLGAAYGFRQAKRRIKYADIEALVAKIKDEAAQNDGKASGATVEEFFQQAFVLNDKGDIDSMVHYVRAILTPSEGRPVNFDTKEVPSFEKFTQLYTKLIVG
jgi:hypothetical protein